VEKDCYSHLIGFASVCFMSAEQMNYIQSEHSGSSHERVGDHTHCQPAGVSGGGADHTHHHPGGVSGGGADHTHHQPAGVSVGGADHTHTKLILELSEQVSSLSGELRQARDTIRRLEERDCYHGNSATNPVADDHCL